jgi:HK97 family phage prohead protease
VTLALAGYATCWNKPVEYDGKRVMMLPTAFDSTLRSGAVVGLWLNHCPDQCVGTNYDHLDLYADTQGLAFRFRIPETEDGLRVKSMAESKDHTCMSIGFHWNDAQTKSCLIDGVEVVYIINATLHEISYLHGFHAGLVKDAYASLQDLDYNESLQENCSGGRFLYEGAAIGVTRALQDLANSR